MDKIILEIVDKDKHSDEKFEKALEILYKAFGRDKEHKEVSAYRSVRDLERISIERVEKLLFKLFNSIQRQWIGIIKSKENDIFRLKGNVYINPQTGKPLTNKEWAILKANILKVFDYIYKDENDRIAKKALALGKVLKRLDKKKAATSTWKELESDVNKTMKTMKGDEWAWTKTFAEQHAGELIVDLSQRQYKQIHDVIQTAITNRISSNELTSNLFDTFSSWNRDWRRIAETEISRSQNAGLIQTYLEDSIDEHVFVKGISAPDACQSCQRLINGKTFILVNAPPSRGGDQIDVDGKTYTAIWVGKSNYGRNRANWWACFPVHPHCRCTMVEYVEGFEKLDHILRESMNIGLTETL